MVKIEFSCTKQTIKRKILQLLKAAESSRKSSNNTTDVEKKLMLQTALDVGYLLRTNPFIQPKSQVKVKRVIVQDKQGIFTHQKE